MSLSPLPSPVVVEPRGPGQIILSVPHSGTRCPADYARRAIGGAATLEALSDPLVDRLVGDIVDQGTGAVIAQTLRALVDPNREETAFHPDAVTGAPAPPPGSKAAAGLGVIASRGLRGRLWHRPFTAEEAASMFKVHRAYHDAIAAMAERVRALRGQCVLLDCHSMPSLAGGAQVVIGTRRGTTASAALAATLGDVVRSRGFTLAYDTPYAGGEIVRRHGDPGAGIHAVQIEIDRALYLDRRMRREGPGLGRIKQLMAALVDAAEAFGPAMAAE